jgi:ParB family chromosome partitioning protein
MANAIKLNLPSADDLFSTQEERDDATREKVAILPLDVIDDHPNHPFRVRMDAEMQELAESVRQYGVLVPGLVRPKADGRYEMVAGHRRKMGSGLAGKSEMPCIIRDLTDDEATIIMVDSNLQRERILPSEKAFAYKMRLEAMKRQGKRTDLTCVPVAHKSENLKSRAVLGKQVGESQDQVRRYIRLTNLIPELLELVDNSVLQEKGKHQIALRPAVELSHLPKEQQQFIYNAIEGEDRTPSHAQTIKMRKFADEGRLNEDVILSIMQEEKPNQAEQLKLPRDKLNRFFRPGTPAQKIESDIIKGLELLRQRERKRNDAR